MSAPTKRVMLASPYGSLLYEAGREHRYIDNGECGTVVGEVNGMPRVRWDVNGDTTDAPQHWLAHIRPAQANEKHSPTPPLSPEDDSNG